METRGIIFVVKPKRPIDEALGALADVRHAVCASLSYASDHADAICWVRKRGCKSTRSSSRGSESASTDVLKDMENFHLGLDGI
jgi:hypothetical protein